MDAKFITFILATFLGACLTTNSPQDTSGIIVYGPERTSFKPCNSDEYIWLNKETSLATGWATVKNIINQQPLCDMSTMPCNSQIAHVFGTALINKNISETNNRGFGHAGKYPAEITFVTIEPARNDICD